jgi:hypothetical protein
MFRRAVQLNLRTNSPGALAAACAEMMADADQVRPLLICRSAVLSIVAYVQSTCTAPGPGFVLALHLGV